MSNAAKNEPQQKFNSSDSKRTLIKYVKRISRYKSCNDIEASTMKAALETFIYETDAERDLLTEELATLRSRAESDAAEIAGLYAKIEEFKPFAGNLEE